ncbi:DsbA family protein [Patescibacteria group bacterium]|nr:DsbA family protein [Patescibacteria group bacterium]MBU1501051.1 DsbA family protein [Patescibacteria group bacterium]MBU2081076.1 DsbA family protein [Patescibacteria group bacterium]MBU2124168.1 DsbA family protein [Patescibacteria group bacterium]MBU2195024.1 DsbA family protein [Patescibacteria group bacterium]
MVDTERIRREYFLPGAIVIAGLILATAVYVVRNDDSPKLTGGNPNAVRAVSPIDHIIGNPEAPVMIVEYADIDSEYSKQFQATMQQIMSEYAAGGKVAWVYRHLPLLDRHAAAGSHAEAAECAAFLGDNDAFWRFIDALQAAAPRENQFPPSGYPAVVSQLALPANEFDQCLKNGRFTKKVLDDTTNALASGAEGTPYTVIVVEGQKPVAINGALSYENMRRVVDEAIARAQ